jgi:hypothetical protein
VRAGWACAICSLRLPKALCSHMRPISPQDPPQGWNMDNENNGMDRVLGEHNQKRKSIKGSWKGSLDEGRQVHFLTCIIRGPRGVNVFRKVEEYLRRRRQGRCRRRPWVVEKWHIGNQGPVDAFGSSDIGFRNTHLNGIVMLLVFHALRRTSWLW